MESTLWSGNVQTFGAQAAGSAAAVFIGATTDPPQTLLRMRGQLVAWIDGLEIPAVGVDVGVGIALVPEGSGTTVTWSPLQDEDAPWWFYTRFTLGYEEYVTDVIDAPGLTVFRETIDLKGMRIIRPDVEAQIVVEQQTLIGAGTVNIVLSERVLFGAT